jgi:hypothetical protein
MPRVAITVVAVSIAAGGALVPGLAGAQQPADLAFALSPATPATASTLGIVADGSAPGIQGRLLRSAAIDAQRGFKIDPAAVTGPCSPADIAASNCPETSRVGRGNATVTANGFFTIPVTIDAFLAAPPVAGDTAGLALTIAAVGKRATSVGRIVPMATGPIGYEVRFDGLDRVTPPAGVTLRLDRLELTLRASRVERRRVTVRKRVRYTDKKGHRRTKIVRKRVLRRINHAFITTPRTCTTGVWTARGTITFADDSTLVRELSAPCQAAP